MRPCSFVNLLFCLTVSTFNGTLSSAAFIAFDPSAFSPVSMSGSVYQPPTKRNKSDSHSVPAMAAASAVAKRAVGKLYPNQSAFLLCDIQERFRPLIHKSDTVVRTAQFMTSVAKALEIPIITTQQYTKVFGPTVADCFADPSDLEARPAFEKKLFSMMTPEVRDHLSSESVGPDRKSFVLFGIEAHVCVQQTALDLLEEGNDVHVIVDGVSSQRPLDREVALRRMEKAGAYLTTAQSAAFMLLGSADHPNFKAVSKLVVQNMKEPNEFHDEGGAGSNEEGK